MRAVKFTDAFIAQIVHEYGEPLEIKEALETGDYLTVGEFLKNGHRSIIPLLEQEHEDVLKGTKESKDLFRYMRQWGDRVHLYFVWQTYGV
ncbi:MAG TPA: hypothetical protein PK295_04035 [Candidatus Magasanikbacteria bacterium]|nr:hypothetical protein [Candidatus Magasanikbacteria bacterium]